MPDPVVDDHEVVVSEPELRAGDRGRQIGPEALVVDAGARDVMGAVREVELVELLGDHRDPRGALDQRGVAGRVDELLVGEAVLPLRRESADLVVGQPESGGHQVLLVVLEVDDVGRVQGGRGAFRRAPDDLAGSPGADHRLGRLAAPAGEQPVEAVVVGDLEAGLPDRLDPVGRPTAAEDHFDPLRVHLLAEVERLDDAVHMELAEVKEEDPHPTVSRRASSSASPPKGGSE